MTMPKRKTIVLLILIAFFLGFFSFMAWYFSGVLFGETVVDDDGTVRRTPGLFPFGDTGIAPPLVVDDNGQVNNNNGQVIGEVNDDGVYIPRLRKITPQPVVAATVFPVSFPGRASKNYDAIRFIAKTTGHVFDARSNSLEVERISNTTIPGIQNGFFTASTTAIIQYGDSQGITKTFSTELARVLGSESENERQLQGIFLDDDMRQITYNDRTGQLFYLSRSVSDPNTTVGIVSDTNGDGKRQIFSSPLSEWRPNWEGETTNISLDSTPSYETFGPTFSLNSTNASLRPFIPARLALQTLTNNANTKSLISLRHENRMKLFLYDIAKETYLDLNFETTVDKCAWDAAGENAYCGVPISGMRGFVPDSWYQGALRLEDEMWVINGSTGLTYPLFNPIEYYDEVIDIIDVQVSVGSKYLVFRNKHDLSLWTYTLDDDIDALFNRPLSEEDFDIDPSEVNTQTGTGSGTEVEVGADIQAILPLEPESEDDDF